MWLGAGGKFINNAAFCSSAHQLVEWVFYMVIKSGNVICSSSCFEIAYNRLQDWIVMMNKRRILSFTACESQAVSCIHVALYTHDELQT